MAARAPDANQPFDRFRSFTERYVIARTGPSTDLQASWQAIQDAKKLYKLMAEAQDPTVEPAQQAGAHRGEGVASPPPMPVTTEFMKHLVQALGASPDAVLNLTRKGPPNVKRT